MRGLSGLLFLVLILIAVIVYIGLGQISFDNNFINQTLNFSTVNNITSNPTQLPATNVTNGTFGANVGNGNYFFPNNLSINGNVSFSNLSLTSIINCLSIVGGDDVDFCTDGGGNGTGGGSNGTSNVVFKRGLTDVSTASGNFINLTVATGDNTDLNLSINETTGKNYFVGFTMSGYTETSGEVQVKIKRDGVSIGGNHFQAAQLTNIYLFSFAISEVIAGSTGEHHYWVEWQVSNNNVYNRPATQAEQRALTIFEIGNVGNVTGGGSGDGNSGNMTTQVYDTAGIAQQLVGINATQTVWNKTYVLPNITGTPTADNQLGVNTTQDSLTYYGNKKIGAVPRVLIVGTGNENRTNNVTVDQNFTTIYTIPANSLFTNKVYRVTALFETITGVSSATEGIYVKLGGIKVITGFSGNPTNSITKSLTMQFLIFGRNDIGANTNISAAQVHSYIVDTDSRGNQIDQPVTGIATNADIPVTLGITYSATGSTETIELQAFMVEELN